MYWFTYLWLNVLKPSQDVLPTVGDLRSGLTYYSHMLTDDIVGFSAEALS